MKGRSIIYIILFLILLLFFIRLISPIHLDDVTPGISCEKELLEKADILYVIPKFEGVKISDNESWCDYILSLNKTIGMHGVTHSYFEFLEDRDEDYLQEGIIIFEECFGFKPNRFKPPNLKISDSNKKLVKKYMKLDLTLSHVFHKVYHCEDTGSFPNSFMDLF